MNIALKAVIGVAISIALSSNVVFADNVVSGQANRNNTQLAVSQVKINQALLQQVQKQREQEEINVEQLDTEIENIMSSIQENKNNINTLETSMKSIQGKIDEIENQVEDKQQLLDQRIRGIYMEGSIGYLSVLLKAKSFSDLISKLSIINRIVTYDQKIISGIEEKKDTINNNLLELKAQKDKLTSLLQDNEQKLALMNDSKDKETQLINYLKAQEQIYGTKIDESPQIEEEILKKIKNNEIINSSYTLSTNNSSQSNASLGMNIVEYAVNYLGTNYVWGGNTPNPGFDCSGFTKYVFARFGITLDRTAREQIKNGISVSTEELQPGDLVFFGSADSPHHVGIYVGNNAFIHAPRTGDVIKISPLTRPDFAGARRVI